MALPLFRSYVLHIVLTIFMILIDKTTSQSALIPSGCKITAAKHNTIELPKNFDVEFHEEFNVREFEDDLSDGGTKSSRAGWIKLTEGGLKIVNLPKGWTVTMPDGFEVDIPSGTEAFFDNSGGNCKMTLNDGWTVKSNKTWKNIIEEDVSIKGYVDIIKEGATEKSIEIEIQAILPKCKVIISQDSQVVIPKGFKIRIQGEFKVDVPKEFIVGEFEDNLPDSGTDVLPDGWTNVLPNGWMTPVPKNWNTVTKNCVILNLPEGCSFTLPEGFMVGPPRGLNVLPMPGWFKRTMDGPTIKLPPRWIVKLTDDLKINNEGGVIEAPST